MSRNPYEDLPPDRFWKHGVATASSSAPPNLYCAKWAIEKSDRIATAGSCFAQHISRYLKQGGFSLLDVEPPPIPLPVERHHAYGYSLYSARYGNIYTSRQLLQIAREAFEGFTPSEVAWTKGGAFYDCFRPGVEPVGLSSPLEVADHRRYHIERVRDLFLSMDVFIFTLGLTECWINSSGGEAYPTVPGSIAGTFDPDRYVFKNLTFREIYKDILRFREIIDAARGGRPFRMLLTVSPVPLTATASNQHVLQATIYSKSVLRAVAGQLQSEFGEIDYYPSYEIITHPWATRDFFDSNKRTVSSEGVALAMKTFMNEHTTLRPNAALGAAPVSALATRSADVAEHSPRDAGESDLKCEEYLLEQWAGETR